MKHIYLALAFIGLLVGIADITLAALLVLNHAPLLATAVNAVSGAILVVNYGVESIR